jgi:hypothetical protein
LIWEEGQLSFRSLQLYFWSFQWCLPDLSGLVNQEVYPPSWLAASSDNKVIPLVCWGSQRPEIVLGPQCALWKGSQGSSQLTAVSPLLCVWSSSWSCLPALPAMANRSRRHWNTYIHILPMCYIKIGWRLHGKLAGLFVHKLEF